MHPIPGRQHRSDGPGLRQRDLPGGFVTVQPGVWTIGIAAMIATVVVKAFF